MAEIQTIVEHARLFAVQHAPAQMLNEVIPVAILTLLVGITVGVLGAKLSRPALTVACGIAGGFVGGYIAREASLPAPVCVGFGALMLAVIGYQAFRLWVGIAAAVVFAGVALGTFGYVRVVPHVAEYERATVALASAESSSFVVLSPGEQTEYLNRKPEDWIRSCWTYVTQQDATIPRTGRALGLVALVTGLCFGLVAARWALILSTSLLGTALVTSSLVALLTQFAPEASYQALEQRPQLVTMAAGGFLLGSLILQTLLTRPAPPESKPAKTKS